MTDNIDLTIDVPKLDPLVQKAYREPHAIELLLKDELLASNLASRLEEACYELVSVTITPNLQGAPPTRTPFFYASCFILGTLLGQAYRLLTAPKQGDLDLSSAKVISDTRLPQELRDQIYSDYGYYIETDEQRKRIWGVIEGVFVKALLNEWDPEPGSHYVAAMIMMACGKALSTTPGLQGHGRYFCWYDGKVGAAKDVWDWAKLKEALLKTSEFPRNNTDYRELVARSTRLRRNRADAVYVSKEILDVLDEARAHVMNGAEDWTAARMTTRFLEPLFSTPEERERFASKDEPEPGWPEKSADPGNYWNF